MQIPDHWRWTTIAEVQSSEKRATITGPFGSSIGKKFFVESGVPVIRGNNLSLRADKFIDEGFVFISEGKAEELRGYKAFKNDLIFTAAGTIGQVGIIPEKTKYEFYIISNKQMRARFNTETVDPTFAYYWFSSPWMVDYIKRHDTGSTIPLINLGVLRSLPMPLPPITEQISISQYIGAIDKKINNNKNINKTLEQMAQALFKSWFVDFDPVKAKIAVLEAGGSHEEATFAAMAAISGKDADSLVVLEQEQHEKFAELKATAELFPSAMQESELVEIPEEWEISSLAEKILLIGGGTPKRSEPSFWDGNICWYSVKDAPNESDVFVIDTIEKITNDGLNKSSTKLLPVGTTIISARGTVGKLALTAIETAMNQSCYGISGGSFSGPFLTYLKVKQCIDALKRNTHGAVFDTITTNTFNAVNVLTAGKKINDRFEEIITPLFNTIKNNLSSNSSLAQLRDTLLPKLLSGDITLPEAEQTVSEATHV